MMLLNIFLTFLKIGTLGFGGGIAMLPIIYQNALALGEISDREFSNLVGISQITPGPIAVNAATYVGYNIAGFPGTIVATIGVSLPSFIFVLLASYFLERFKESDVINGALTGIRPASVGLMASAVMFMGSQAFADVSGGETLISGALFLASLILIGKVRVSPLTVVAAAGVIGALFLS